MHPPHSHHPLEEKQQAKDGGLKSVHCLNSYRNTLVVTQLPAATQNDDGRISFYEMMLTAFFHKHFINFPKRQHIVSKATVL